jgi:hypothetical protein
MKSTYCGERRGERSLAQTRIYLALTRSNHLSIISREAIHLMFSKAVIQKLLGDSARIIFTS